MNTIKDKSTIKDVAKAAGVSVATVSRVINNNYVVSEEVTQRVQQAISDLGYYSNSIARSLRVNSTNTIGFVVANISNSYHVSMAQAVENEIKKYNYNMIMCSTMDSRDGEISYLKLLQSKNVDGIILQTTGKNDDFVLEMNKHIPIVLINRRIVQGEFVGDLVDSNNQNGAYILARQLLMLRHKKILVLRGPKYISNANERFAGFVKAMNEFGLQADQSYPFQKICEMSVKGGFNAAESMYSLPELPTAVLSLSNLVSMGFLKALRKKNINLPEDLSFVGFDDIDNWDLMQSRPTLVKYNSVEMGKQAGSAIMERIKDRSIPNREFIFEPELVKGNTLGLPKEDNDW